MEVDELAGNDYVPVSNYVFFSFIHSYCFHKPPGPLQPPSKFGKALEQAAELQKCKGSTSLHVRGTAKCQANLPQQKVSSSQQQPITAEEIPDDTFEVSNYPSSHPTVNQTG